jgi:hypothetical protein
MHAKLGIQGKRGKLTFLFWSEQTGREKQRLAVF